MNVKRGTSQSKSRRPATSQSQFRRRRLLIEGLEIRSLMAGGVSPTDGIGLIDDVAPRNIGAVDVDAFNFTEVELSNGRGLNDSIQRAEFLPLGTIAGKQNTIDVTGSLPQAQISSGITGSLPEDQDYFSFDLRAGDILDVAGIGSAGGIDLFFANGRRWFATESNQEAGFSTPSNSPLMDVGNVVAAQVIPETGRYYLRVASTGLGTSYTLGLRVYRPVLEQQPIGTKQKIFLDFDGATLPASVFAGIPGTVRIPSFADSLTLLNLEAKDESQFIDKVIKQFQAAFSSIARLGGNGDFNATGVAGQFGYEILNSRDNADAEDDPNTTRVFIGGTTADVLVANILGVAQTLDVGNFDLSEYLLVPLDFYEATVATTTISNAVSQLDALAFLMGNVIAHEVGHSVGLWHTNNADLTASLIDAGGANFARNYFGVGADGIFGTADDAVIGFPVFDQFDPTEGYIGNEYVASSAAWALSTGTVGGLLTGTVFTDVNRDGLLTSNSDTGLAGVTVFVDNNGNGVLDAGETSTVSIANGTYSIAVAPGTVRIAVVAPTSFTKTTPTQTVTVTSSGAANVNLGVARVNSDITGTKWADLNGDGIKDAGEPGIAGVYIYLDLDGDGRIDIGEPRAVTGSDGSYKLNFPSPGTYTIREVVAPGFVQTAPAGGAFTVVFNGSALTDNYNFGNLPSLDFGDAPDSYKTTLASGGPSHGLLAGLSLGGAPDRELDGTPTVGADGDDNSGTDDEDGVRVLTPIAAGSTATFQVVLNNTTGQTGYLEAWFDFNRDGSFTGPGERVITDATVAPGPNGTFPIAIPASVTPGSLYTRFRYSLTAGLGVGGQADAGEVEDHLFTINSSANLANDDTFALTRNSQANSLNVLANDFDPSLDLKITSVDQFVLGTRGTVTIANGGRSILYTPPNGFTGRDSFKYTVTSPSGQTATATVTLNVSFLSDVPIAVDDTFEVAEGSSNIALNVLDNDIQSRLGGVTIISVTPGSQGGQTSLAGGSQTVRYTPRPGFGGTEEFTYSISDTAGNVSSAKATINLLPGSQDDDLVAYSIHFFDSVNSNTEITNVQAGQTFFARVSVEDLRAPLSNDGVYSAFLDLLYSNELVAPVPNSNNAFGFDITFGDSFYNLANNDAGLESGDADTPGLFNEVGSQGTSIANPMPNAGPVTLFTVRMQAVAPGIALFKSNPADVAVNETTLYNSQTAVPVSQQRLGSGEITISPTGGSFTSAIDDSFPNGVDSNGVQIQGGRAATLNVTKNDNLGPTGVIDSFSILTTPILGTAVIGPNNTILYTPADSAVGLDTFSYTIVTADGVRSSAQVTLTVGNAAADDTLKIGLKVVDGNGASLEGKNISVGTRFGVQVIVQDLRRAIDTNPPGVFAAFADILYNAGLATPVPATPTTTLPFNFTVEFSPDYQDGAFGSADRPGIIDEFGSFLTNGSLTPNINNQPALLATLFFTATAAGTLNFTAGPADSLPFHDSLLFDTPSPVPVSKIQYGISSVTIGGASSEGEARQNAIRPADVNDDGFVTPVDALLVINQLSRRTRSEGEAAGTSSTRYTDVSGDGKVSALDALQVINVIGRRNRMATPAPVVTTPAQRVAAVETYEQLAAITTRRTPTTSSTHSLVAAPLTSVMTAEGEAADNKDESPEDVVDLLAHDIANVWK